MILSVIIILLFISCGESGLYTKLYDNTFKGANVANISFKTDNYYLLDKVQRSFKKFGFREGKMSKYHIVLTSHYVINCKNPVVHALGADFNGYIRLSFYKKKKEIYRIQKDFKSKVTNSMINKIVKRLIKNLSLKPARL